MGPSARQALITGGASGIGLAVAETLLASGSWEVHLLDINQQRGDEALHSLGPKSSFYHIDTTDYTALSRVFGEVFEENQRLDCVFANAGVISSQDFYHENQNDKGSEHTPAEPNRRTLGVDLDAVITTSYLARYYLRRSNTPERKDLIITASCAGFYAVPNDPIYAAAKHGAVGFVRSIGPRFWKGDGIRTNAICPGLVRTNILPQEVFQAFPEETVTPIEKVVDVVMMLLTGNEHVGKTVEIFGKRHWVREQYEYCDPGMAALMGVTEDL